jgi:hypothetical protein
MDPQTAPVALRELARNLISAIFPFIACIVGLHAPWGLATLLMASFALWATAVAVWYGVEAKRGHDVDPWVDLLHGLGFGMLVSILSWQAA